MLDILCCNAGESLDVARDVLRAKISAEEAKKRILLAPNNWIHTVRTK